MLDENQRKELLKIARETLQDALNKRSGPVLNVTDPLLKEEKAVFVTLRKNKELRGCIGNLTATEPLYLAVKHMAIEAATQDPRFSPVRPEELASLDIEISVLGNPERVAGAEAIVMGKHGVIVKRGTRRGVFLPQVAAETGWSKEEFLNELCSQKAGLPSDCWKDKNTELFVFTSEEFGEAEDQN